MGEGDTSEETMAAELLADFEAYGQIPATHGELEGLSCPCNTCAHVFPGYAFCEAFPDGDGIPFEIVSSQSRHIEPWPGDHGLRYQHDPALGPKPEWAP